MSIEIGKCCVSCLKKRGGLINWIGSGCFPECPNYKIFNKKSDQSNARLLEGEK